MKLRKLIDEAGLTISEVVRLSGVDRTTIYAIINNSRSVRNSTYGKIAKVLDCKIEDIKDQEVLYMVLYYDFNGLWSYEYSITDEDIIRAVFELYGTINDIRFADTTFKLYRRDIYNYFEAKAYRSYLQTDDGKYGILDPHHLVNNGNPM